MAAIIFTITSEGLTASLDAANTGLGLQLTHVSGHDAAGVEIGRWPLSGGIVEPNSNTLRFSSVMTSTSRKELYGLKLLADSLVFATAVGASPLVVVDANIDFAPSFGLALESIPVGNITVTTDPNAPLAIILMLQHVGSANPHPQYAMDAQNALEHANLLALIQALNQRVTNLEIREEIQIGEFVITDDPRNPATYKGYGHFRLVPDVLLKGLSSSGVTGQYSQVASGAGQQVRTTFFWQRFDPNEILPVRTVYVDQDMTDVVLYDLYVERFGLPIADQQIVFEIMPDVLVTSSSTLTAAMRSGLGWPTGCTITVNNYGIHAGRGGDGAAGTQNGGGSNNGHQGGAALDGSDYPFSYINHAILAGGGGGGGTGNVNGDGSVGGSGGAPYGLGGIGSSSYTGDPSDVRGNDAGRLSGGAAQTLANAGSPVVGGAGGDVGLAGHDGQNNTPAYAGSSGGLAGQPIINGVSITLINQGSLLGFGV